MAGRGRSRRAVALANSPRALAALPSMKHKCGSHLIPLAPFVYIRGEVLVQVDQRLNQ
jgi:hypothetical protein